jgi:hypothetical protein
MESLMKRFWMIFTIVLIYPWILPGQYFQKFPSGGIIDWTELVIRETGTGFPNPNLPISAQRSAATEAAKKDAENKLYELIKNINLNSQNTIEYYLTSNDSLVMEIKNRLQNIKVIDIRYKNNGAVEIEAEVPLSFIFKTVLPPPLLYPPEATEVPDSSEVTPASGIYTGLILDARGLDIYPALYPEIYDEKNHLVYGIKQVHLNNIYQWGITCYERSLERARANKRITNNPLIIKAIDIRGENKTDGIISNRDAQEILSAQQVSDFLVKGRVIFVID